jgi:integrase
MPRQLNMLTVLKIKSLSKKGLYHDGSGLYMQINPSGSKSWIFRFMLRSKSRSMGLGPTQLVTLSEARMKAHTMRRLLLDGIDPIEHRKEERKVHVKVIVPSFDECADTYITEHEQTWKNDKHKAQWRSTLKMYASPVIGKMPVNEVEDHHIKSILVPIWQSKHETASRLRGRIESVLDWATVHKFRKGENPARWKGHFEIMFAKLSKAKAANHHPALAIGEMPQFMTNLQIQQGNGARALEFLILTACRTGEVMGAQWSEFNLAEHYWLIPRERMKAAKEHKVALSKQAVKIIEAMRSDVNVSRYVFVGNKGDKPLSNMAMLMLIRRMNYEELTSHGFRSTFRDWIAEKTQYPHELAEMALAHSIGNKVEAAYRRGDMFEKRIQLMQDWADYCYGEKNETYSDR